MKSPITSLIFFMLACLVGAQESPIYGGPEARLKVVSDVVVQTIDNDGILSVHAAGLISLVGLPDGGELVASFYTSGHANEGIPQGPIGQEPVQLLSTTWCDEKGMTHEVVTPVISQTPAGLAKAVELHTALVSKMQALHPPKPCPPPAPPAPPGG